VIYAKFAAIVVYIPTRRKGALLIMVYQSPLALTAVLYHSGFNLSYFPWFHGRLMRLLIS
jgi:hypothetical protein